MSISQGEFNNLESLATELIRCSVEYLDAAKSGEDLELIHTRDSAIEARQEYDAAVLKVFSKPLTLLNLIREIRCHSNDIRALQDRLAAALD